MKATIALIMAVAISSCSKADLTPYAANKPEFDVYSYFAGKTTGWGQVQNRSGELIRRFVVDIEGVTNDDGSLVLHEEFSWSDGERSSRVWTIHRDGENGYVATAGDVSGMAVGRSSGNVLNWRYYLDIDVSGSTWKVHLDDWMYLHPNQILINKSQMSKFGVRLGEITIAFSKLQQGGDQP